MNKENKDQALTAVGSAPTTLEREKRKRKDKATTQQQRSKKKGKTKDVLHLTSAVERSVIAKLSQKKKELLKDDEEVCRYKHELVQRSFLYM